jgi:hypothetical protein
MDMSPFKGLVILVTWLEALHIFGLYFTTAELGREIGEKST